ncbi:MAG: ribonuclease III [Saprospiraceae bacterium]
MPIVLRLFRRFYNLYFHPEKELARRLRTMLGFTPAYLNLFKLAFYHKSTFSAGEYAISNNERLEFLGDAVLSTIVAEYLFTKYPNSDEGFLTKMRSKIVKRQSLDEIADRMGLDLFLSNYNSTRLSKSMLGNALEALVGAIYIEVGYDKTKQYVIRRILRRYLNIHDLEQFDDNYKSQLLEWCQKNGRQIDYKVLAKYKSDKRDKFKVAVYVDGKKVGTADDFNKKSAEQMASERAMLSMHIIERTGDSPAFVPDDDSDESEN